MKALIICVECKKNAETDKKYIQNVISNFYNIDTSIKINYINFTGKGNYKSQKTLKKIDEIKRRLHCTEIAVIYCIDIDKEQADSYASQINEEIKQFCNNKEYEFVWFCENVEDVFLHKEINDSREKIKEAKRIGRENNIGKATIKSLSSKVVAKRKSNLMIVLGKYLRRKH